MGFGSGSRGWGTRVCADGVRDLLRRTAAGAAFRLALQLGLGPPSPGVEHWEEDAPN